MKKTSIVTILVAFGALSATPIGSSAAAVWDQEQQLTAGDYDEYTDAAGQRNVVVDPQGRIHVVWYVEDYLLPNPFQIYYKRYNPGSGWTQDTCLTPDLMAQNIYNRYPSITVDAQGNLHLVWCAGPTTRALSTIYYKRCTPSGSGNGGWQDTARSIGPGMGADSVYTPDVACSPNGHVHVVWSRRNTSFLGIRYRESSDGGNTWLSEISIFDTTAEGGPQNNPTVACAPNNSVHIAWSGKDYWGGAFHLYYRKRIGVTWFAREGVVMSSADQYLPSIAISPITGNPHIVWRRYFSLSAYEIVHTYWDNVWQPVQVISGTIDTTQNNPQLAFTPDGSAHAVWHGTSPASPSIRQIRYNERTPAGVWGTPLDLTTASVRQRDYPSIAIQNHDLHVVWQDDRGTYQNLYYGHGFASFHDVGCSVILSPVGLVDSGTVLTPACSLKNYDTTAENYTVRMKIGAGYNETATVTTHQPGTVRYIAFPQWTALPRGVLAVSCSTELSSDANRTNDRLVGTVSVRVADMALTSIVRPIAIEAPGSIPVIVRTRNAGSENTDCRVRVIIIDSVGGEVYNQYRDYTAIAPGDSVQAQLSAWTADVPGIYYARARVSTPGDQNPGNDSLTCYVTVEATGIEQPPTSIPVSLVFAGTSPNPFADRTTLSYTLPSAAPVHLRAYSATGRLVRVLLSGVQPAGRHVLTWDGRDAQQRRLGRGIYFFRFESGSFKSIEQLIKLE
jgi:FlgD Ig-like domain